MRSHILGLFLILGCLAPAQQRKNDTYRGGLVTPPLPKPPAPLSTFADVIGEGATLLKEYGNPHAGVEFQTS